eukprot:6455191-Amphidinium_carterae.4
MIPCCREREADGVSSCVRCPRDPQRLRASRQLGFRLRLLSHRIELACEGLCSLEGASFKFLACCIVVECLAVLLPGLMCRQDGSHTALLRRGGCLGVRIDGARSTRTCLQLAMPYSARQTWQVGRTQ